MYRVTKPWGKRKTGDLLPESREARRKLAEGGCLEKVDDRSKAKKQKDSNKNKMGPDTRDFSPEQDPKNKGAE